MISTQLDAEFNNHFRFQINEPIRHKADQKEYSSDMGLLILNRVLIQSDGDDGTYYEKYYHCRVIAFSGSGRVEQFRENELMSIKEYEEAKLKGDQERNDMRNEARKVEKEILQLFDVSKEDYLFLVKDGKVDESKKFRVSGFTTMEGKIKLYLTESLLTVDKDDVKRNKAEVSSMEEFRKVGYSK